LIKESVIVNTILCTTRGGEASFPNQDRAVQLAKEQGSPLIFMHVTNVEFLDHLASPVLIDIESELKHMGEFVLAMAQERAEKAGVEVTTVSKIGDLKQALLEVIHDFDIHTVILGSPAGETALTTQSYLQGLIQSLLKETDVEVIVVHNGEVIEQYPQT
jgi:nucleotide-binding universal stress UspA family protein